METDTVNFVTLSVMKDSPTRLLKKDSYDLIDFLPEPVSKGKGNYFEVEQYLLKHGKKIQGHFIQFFLKLYCYMDFDVDYNKKEYSNPSPKKLASLIKDSWNKQLILQIKTGKLDFLLSGDDLYITVYGLDETTRPLVEKLAASENLFVRSRTL